MEMVLTLDDSAICRHDRIGLEEYLAMRQRGSGNDVANNEISRIDDHHSPIAHNASRRRTHSVVQLDFGYLITSILHPHEET